MTENIIQASVSQEMIDISAYQQEAGKNGHRTMQVNFLRYEADDNGNAETMRDLYGEKFLYSPALGWLQYTGTHYEQIPEEVTMSYASETLRLRRHAAVDAKNETLIKAAKQSAYNIHACVQMFRPYVIVTDINEFDSDPDLLNCQNGVVNLRTGSVTPHLPCQRFTYCVPVDYKPDADIALWNTFIHEAIKNESIVHYLQKCVGYSLTGHTREEKLFYIYGPPRAGKGTFTETLLTLLPRPMGTECDFNSFTARRDADSQNFDLASLKTTRFLVASESNRYQSLNPAKVKQITGGNWIRCAFKHRDMFEYRPQFKVWLISNHPVNADADDDALWGRIQVFNFPHSYLNQENTTLKPHLKLPENLEGVLRWAVEGAMSWYQDDRLKPPQDIVDATQRHRDSQDYVGQWIADCCILGNEQLFTKSSALTASYQEWCKGNNVKAERAQDFAGTLVKRFHCIFTRKEHGKVRGYKGIALVDESLGGDGVTHGDTQNGVFPATENSSETSPIQPSPSVTRHPSTSAESQSTATFDQEHQTVMTPEESTNYPTDVFAWLKENNIRTNRIYCLRGHENSKPLPYYNDGAWEYVCSSCYGKALLATNGKECDLDEQEKEA